MSCRSTACSSATLFLARSSSGLTDGQAQSLFHSLKRDCGEATPPGRQEYEELVERLMMDARYNIDSDKQRRRVLGRLHRASDDPLPSAPMWFAMQNVRAEAELASQQIDSLCARAAARLRVSPSRLRDVFQDWAANPAGYEHVAPPDPRFQHDPAALGLPGDAGTRAALQRLGYEEFLAQPYPVFVYGTLRQGQGNSGIMEPAVCHVQRATLTGVGIYGANAGFPYAAEHDDPAALTVGEVVSLDDGVEGLHARIRLDQLEGFHSSHPSSSHYERVLRTVTVDGGEGVDAWVYLARGYSLERLRESDRILHGDWVAARPPLAGWGRR